MEYQVRKAKESDRFNIARTIANSFKKEFSILTKDMERIAHAFEHGIDISRFFVTEQDDKIIGIIACTDCTGRAVKVNKKECTKHLGFIWGLICFKIFSNEFMFPLKYPITTGYIEFVGVLERARGKGIAKEMLNEIINYNSQYNEFILDVYDVNIPAQKSYIDFGFVEFNRIPVKYAKLKGFNAKVCMKYMK